MGKSKKNRQLELIPSHMLIDFHVGWYYLYNPKKRPHEGTIMPVCKLIGVETTPIGRRCTIRVIGDLGTKDAYADELVPMIMIRPDEANNFSELFFVAAEQMKIWRKSHV